MNWELKFSSTQCRRPPPMATLSWHQSARASAAVGRDWSLNVNLFAVSLRSLLWTVRFYLVRMHWAGYCLHESFGWSCILVVLPSTTLLLSEYSASLHLMLERSLFLSASQATRPRWLCVCVRVCTEFCARACMLREFVLDSWEFVLGLHVVQAVVSGIVSSREAFSRCMLCIF